MQELVGHCKECKKPIYCNDGFLNGVILEDKSVVCFECSEKGEEEPSDHPKYGGPIAW